MINLMMLASEPELAQEAQEAGIDRIFFDLEFIGKAERQRGRDTVQSKNCIEDIPKIRNVLTSSNLLVRTNPINPFTKEEVEKAIRYGADILMLPMVMDRNDVEEYVDIIRGRTKVCIMIETAAALARIDKILSVPGVDELFIGLNDLHISMNLSFMFELLSGGIVEYIANKCRAVNMPFGFGGIARIGEGLLMSDNILGEHVRLGSTSVILSRTFKGEVGTTKDRSFNLREEVQKVRSCIEDFSLWTQSDFQNNKDVVKISVDKVLKALLQKS